MSVHEALLAALPGASMSVKRYDHLALGFPASLAPSGLGDAVLVDERELDGMSRSDLVSGHFYLDTLLRIAPPQSIATVLREPRARILSLYAFWRFARSDEGVPQDRLVDRAVGPLDQFLSDPPLAPHVDNLICRMVVGADPRIPGVGMIPPEHIEGIASDAVDWLDQLAFVGVLERQETTWEGLSRFFGAPLKRTQINVTASDRFAPHQLPMPAPISDRTLGLLEARTAADAIVYRHVLMADSTEAEAKQISDAAFAAQLVRFGDIASSSAASAHSLTRRVAETELKIGV